MLFLWPFLLNRNIDIIYVETKEFLPYLIQEAQGAAFLCFMFLGFVGELQM